MNFISLIRIAFKALLRNKLRAFLTMLGIIIGVASVIAMVAIGQGSKLSIQTQLSGMGSNMIVIRPNSNVTGGARLDASSVQTLTLPDVTALQKIDLAECGFSIRNSQGTGHLWKQQLVHNHSGVNTLYLTLSGNGPCRPAMNLQTGI